MTTEKEKINIINGDLSELKKGFMSIGWEENIYRLPITLIENFKEAGKSEAIKLGNELIEEYFDKPSSVFWDKLKGELTTK